MLLMVVVLAAMPAASAHPPLAQQPAPSASSDFGINSHIASRSIHQQTLPVAADLIAGTGAGWVREDFFWYRIEEQPGQYDWEFFDNTVLLLKERGVNIIGVLAPSVGWATPYPHDTPHDVSYYPPDPQRYAEFVGKVVERYKDLVFHWQVWNEPDNAFYWKPAPDPAAYAELLKVAYPAIKAANPQAQVLISGLVPFDLGFLRSIAHHGAWNAFDIIAVNPYGDPFSPEEGQIGSAGVEAVKIVADQFGAKPIWATEFGWATGPSDRDPAGLTNEETQANFLVRSMVLLRAAGAERVLWYKLKDTDINNPYGLFSFGSALDDYSQPKPSLAAFRTLNQQLAGTTLVGVQQIGTWQVVRDLEDAGAWRITEGTQSTLTRSTQPPHSGTAALQLEYRFASASDERVVVVPDTPLPITGSPAHLGMWLYGDGSGHVVRVRVQDAEGEVLQFRLGYAGAPGWQLLSVPLGGEVTPVNQVGGAASGNRRVDYPISITALVLENQRHDINTSGTLALDSLVAMPGPAVYSVRFTRDGQAIDVLWAPDGAQVSIPTTTQQATLVDRSGETTSIAAPQGTLALTLGAAPVYLHHLPDEQAPPLFPLPLPETDLPAPPDLPDTPGESSLPPVSGEEPQERGDERDAGTPPGRVALPAEVPTLPVPSDGAFADSAFLTRWARTDLPVAEQVAGLQERSWLWGPQPLTQGMHEPYAEGAGGVRLVQYFDKSRMEINDPAAPRDEWYVTNGLLVVEMLTGQVQRGDHTSEQREPAVQAVAGDRIEINPTAPTYRLLRQVAYPTNPQRAPNRQGEIVTEVLRGEGSGATRPVVQDERMARYHVVLEMYEEELGHNIPQVFTDFFAQQGLIYEQSSYRNGQLLDWRSVMGLPITEPYWARVRVGGVEQDVLIQAFQRRVLTYTPTNDPAWRVEMGNVGEHYLRWRYGW